MSDKIIVIRSGALTPTAAVAGPKPVYVSQSQFEQLEADLGAGSPALELFRVRTSAGTTRALRAAGAGGICPYFGMDYQTTEGIHHPADCGKEHDGKFARKGEAAKGTGYEGHLAWASKGAPTKKPVRKTAVAAS